MNTFSYGPISPSIRLGYAPSDQSSQPFDPRIPITYDASNILEQHMIQQDAFGYAGTCGPPFAEYGMLNVGSYYDTADQIGISPILPDGPQLHDFGWQFDQQDISFGDGMSSTNIYLWIGGQWTDQTSAPENDDYDDLIC